MLLQLSKFRVFLFTSYLWTLRVKEICFGNMLVLLSMTKKDAIQQIPILRVVAIWRKINQVKPNLHSACVYVIIYVVN